MTITTHDLFLWQIVVFIDLQPLGDHNYYNMANWHNMTLFIHNLWHKENIANHVWVTEKCSPSGELPGLSTSVSLPVKSYT
jgi:hypothetical protein